MTIKDVCEKLNTSVEKGLTAEQAAKIRESAGKNKIKSLKLLSYTSCLRNGEIINVPTKHLTVGDVVQLKAPFIVPADIVVIKATEDARVDKSSLTGESEPKKVSSTETHKNPLESSNFLLAGTRLTTGSCEGIVVTVGKNTIFGKVSGLGL